MTVENFAFRENSVGSEVAGHENRLNLDQHFRSTKGLNMEFIKNFNFQSIRKAETISLPIMLL